MLYRDVEYYYNGKSASHQNKIFSSVNLEIKESVIKCVVIQKMCDTIVIRKNFYRLVACGREKQVMSN